MCLVPRNCRTYLGSTQTLFHHHQLSPASRACPVVDDGCLRCYPGSTSHQGRQWILETKYQKWMRMWRRSWWFLSCLRILDLEETTGPCSLDSQSQLPQVVLG